MDRHAIDHVTLYYFGTADPDFYGFSYSRITPQDLAAPRPGVYAISLHHLIRLQRTGESWLQRRQPFDRAGTSI
jgi:hypothetical protein